MIENRVGLSLLACLGLFLTACGSEGGSGDEGGGCEMDEVPCRQGCLPEPDGSLAWVQSQVFDASGCAASSSCHNGASSDPEVGFDLSNAEASFDSLVNEESAQAAPKLLVEPNDVNGSYLVNKLTGEDIGGTRLMPFGATRPLCEARIDGVRAWIEAGANPE